MATGPSIRICTIAPYMNTKYHVVPDSCQTTPKISLALVAPQKYQYNKTIKLDSSKGSAYLQAVINASNDKDSHELITSIIRKHTLQNQHNKNIIFLGSYSVNDYGAGNYGYCKLDPNRILEFYRQVHAS